LIKQHPQLAVPHDVYADVLNVTSEVYWPVAEELVHILLDEIEARYPVIGFIRFSGVFER
jgi:hypothetical protein